MAYNRLDECVARNHHLLHELRQRIQPVMLDLCDTPPQCTRAEGSDNGPAHAPLAAELHQVCRRLDDQNDFLQLMLSKLEL